MFFHLGRYVLLLRAMLCFTNKSRLLRQEVGKQAAEMAALALPIVIIISVFIGAVTTVQTAYQLVSPVIPRAAIAQIVREAVLLEFSPTLICIVLSGVLGSRMTSEVGNMRITEQIDALETMGVNSANWLLLPRVMTAVVVIPSLTIISAACAIFGGRLAGDLTGIIDPELFDIGLLRDFKPFTLYFMLIKSGWFAMLLASVACYHGFFCRGGALELGRATTRSVMYNSVLILLFDYILSWLLLS